MASALQQVRSAMEQAAAVRQQQTLQRGDNERSTAPLRHGWWKGAATRALRSQYALESTLEVSLLRRRRRRRRRPSAEPAEPAEPRPAAAWRWRLRDASSFSANEEGVRREGNVST